MNQADKSMVIYNFLRKYSSRVQETLFCNILKHFQYIFYVPDKALLNEIEGILDHIKPLFDDFLLEEEKPNFSKYLREKVII